MTRRTFSDLLQNYAFWLMDVAPVEPLSLPIFTPIFGFSEISMPELTLDVESIQEGGRIFKRKVIKSGDIGNMVLRRGVRVFDSDFYRWFTSAAYGDTNSRRVGAKQAFSIGGPTFRRRLVLIQYFARTPFDNPEALGTMINAGLITIGGATASAPTPVGLAQGLASGFAGGVSLSIGPMEFARRVPARAFFLSGCIPVRYKPASDMSAMNSEVSISELEIAIESLEEISLAN